ncbi:MAG: DUF3160 domain-containing protein [Deltaproteobacteria bacterium]|nr:MAG: DUF3160 domain-containing protein [Deltaproteobacteria bacterium]
MRMTTTAALVAALTLSVPAGALAASAPEPVEQELFSSWVGKYQDMTVEQLAKALGVPLSPAADAKLPFDVKKAEFYDHVAKALGLTPAQRAQLQRDGVLVVPQSRFYSVGAALYEMYTKDLPLLVTTDAILDAMHRSFDGILAELEETALTQNLREALSSAAYALPELVKASPELREAAEDVDLYLAVAMNLLSGEPSRTSLMFAPRLVKPEEVLAILEKVDSLELENPGFGGGSTHIYGRDRAVDWSQFKPRGHYTRSEQLQRYFRAMMWLGRADTGFELKHVRQARAAALLTQLFVETGADKKAQLLRDVVDLMVGRSDNLTPEQLTQVMREQKLATPSALVGDAAIKRLVTAVAEAGFGQQRIRSQLVVSPPWDPKKVAPPDLFQLFGQRFILDSFVLAKVVYDDIIFEGKKMKRRMPLGLDAMAALGNDFAVQMLVPELKTWKYAANLMALRDVVAARSAERWRDSLYDTWLAVLRTLNAPPTGKHVPAVMQRQAWSRKMLQTQLASWAQLRHDTILYAKQSFTASVGCLYPKGYVEPYPAFYGELERFAQDAATRFRALGVDGRYAGYFDNFAKVMKRLRGMAEKELAGKPFSGAEEDFLKNTIEKRVGGGGYVPTATWDGWYISLVFRAMGEDTDAAIEWKPTIADVHTDPDAGLVLEEGTGNVDFTIAVIDNDGDLAVHVGPTLSYYEFTHPAGDRLTDEQWTGMVANPKTAPARPAWVTPILAAP